MKTVKDVMHAKGYSDVWSIAPDATVYDALKVMSEKDIGALLVIDQGKLVGIISERDYARRIILQGKHSADTPVRDIMTANPYTVSPDIRVMECMMMMTEKKIRHLPVLENDKLIGVISIGNVVKSIIIEQDILIENLQEYIKGKYL